MNIELGPHERLDDLVLDGMKVIQRDDQFCFSLDTVLLAHFGAVPTARPWTWDGHGGYPPHLDGPRRQEADGREFNPVMADIARRNVALNGRDDRITLVEGDYRRIRDWAASGAFAAVYANPPYREKSRGAYSDVDGIRRACHEETATLGDVLDAVKYALKYHGRFRMVHITERLADILEAMRAHDIEPKVLQMVHGRPDKKAKLFLIEGIRGGSKGLDVLPPLIVHNPDGSYSDAVNKLYGKL